MNGFGGNKPSVIATISGEKDYNLPVMNSPVVDINKEEDDPWAMTELVDTGPKWSELNSREKLRRAGYTVLKLICLIALLYFFICSLNLMSSSFMMLGGKAAGSLFRDAELLQNPVVGIMIGVMLTILVQSSSTSSSIVVSIVAAGMMDVRVAIFIIMGVNVGTSVTNTIVSLGQIGDRNEFRRAFAGATIHDMFNWLTLITLFIVELITGYLYRVTDLMVAGLASSNGTKSGKMNFLKVLTKPFTNLIIVVDKKVQQAWTLGEDAIEDPKMLKLFNRTTMRKLTCGDDDCSYIFRHVSWSDSVIGAVCLILALSLLCGALLIMVKILKSMLQGSIAMVIKKTANSDLPYVPWLTGYIAMLLGCVFTILVQSSSVFTSALTPLAGLGVIQLERMYPLCLGSNIGTTATAVLAALAADPQYIRYSIQVSLCHLLFNLSGIILFYIIPFMRFPISLARMLGNITAKYRWFAILYMIGMFVLLPVFVFTLSLAGTLTMMIVGIPLVAILAIAVIINILQNKKPKVLPGFLKTWDFLPLCLHSLKPYDRLLSKCACTCCSRSEEKSSDLTEVAVDNPAYESDKP